MTMFPWLPWYGDDEIEDGDERQGQYDPRPVSPRLHGYLCVWVDEVEEGYERQDGDDEDEQDEQAGLLDARHGLEKTHFFAVPDTRQMLLAVGVGHELR